MDLATIQAARAGDREACAALLRSLADPWYRVAWAMLGNEDSARDAVQEAAVRLLRDIRQFRAECQIKTWAIGILINVVREQRRARRRAAGQAVAGEGEAESADGIVEQEEQQALLRELLDDLPQRQREALVLRFFEDLSVQDTAAAMKCAAGTVKATVHQALRALRQRLMGPARRP